MTSNLAKASSIRGPLYIARIRDRLLAFSIRVSSVFCRWRASRSLPSRRRISSSLALSPSSSWAMSPSVVSANDLALAFSSSAAVARSSRPFDSASSAFSAQLAWAASARATARRISFWSAIVRAAPARTSTSVSSISMMIMRIILAGSSARSRRSATLAATMSRVREKMLMGRVSEGATCFRRSARR